MDFNDLGDVLAGLKMSQEAEHDMRDYAREAHHFIDKRDGQWEPSIISRMKGRPRYTLDKCGPVVDQISGEIDNADFTIRVRPAGGDASKDNAKIYDGLIRNIRNISNAESVFKAASRSAITGGIDGWEIIQDWVDADAFDQDLFIRKIHNFVDRVWFDPMTEEQDNSDAKWVVVQSQISFEEFEERFENSPDSGLSDGRLDTVYTFKPTDMLTIGKFLYKKPRNIKLVKMSNGMIYQDDDKFAKVKDELAAAGITEEDTRTRKGWRVYSRLFSNDKWLTEEEETVFDFLPVISVYGNYKVSENKRIYRGVVEKMIDPQRIYNYTASKQVEDVAFSPVDKFFMTAKQAKGHTSTLETMNTNNNPVQLYNSDPEAPPPFRTNAAQVNQGAAHIALQASDDLNAAAGLFSANMGDNPGLQSGVALDIQASKGDNGMTKWVDAIEVAICYTGKVLVNAIPRVYDSSRSVRILNEDGTFEMQTINQRVVDQETQEVVELNNLASGQYDVTCEAGLAFKSRQRESLAAFVELGAVDPSIIELGGDVFLKNSDAEGMGVVGERKRLLMLREGKIPQSQMTDEEKQQLQAQQQQQQGQEDPSTVIAQAEMLKGQAEMQNAQNKQVEIQGNQQLEAAKLQLAQQQLELDGQKFVMSKDDKFNVDAATIQLNQQKLLLAEQKQVADQRNQNFKLVLAEQAQHVKNLTELVNQMKGIREASGVDVIMGPGIVDNFKTQSNIISEEQNDLE